jgi:hypothetical protein
MAGPNLNAPGGAEVPFADRASASNSSSGGALRPDDQDHRRTHRAVAAVPGVAHFAPSVAPLVHTSEIRISSSAHCALSVPVTMRNGGDGPPNFPRRSQEGHQEDE